MIGWMLAAPLFVRPLALWDYWWIWIFPLCAAIAIVHKSVKCEKMERVPREAAEITFWILAGMIGAGAALWVLVEWAGR